MPFPKGYIGKVAQAIYDETIRDRVGPTEEGKLIVIDIQSWDYEIDDDHHAARLRLRTRQPDSITWTTRVGGRSERAAGPERFDSLCPEDENPHPPTKLIEFPEGYIERLGQRIYEEEIRHIVEPTEERGFVVIDIHTGDYEVGGDDWTPTLRLWERKPGAITWAERVGDAAFPTLSLGSPHLSEENDQG